MYTLALSGDEATARGLRASAGSGTVATTRSVTVSTTLTVLSHSFATYAN